MPLSELYNEDCVEGMKRYPDNHFRLAIVDPPYGIDVAKNGKVGGNKPFGKKANYLKNNTNKRVILSNDYGKKDWDSAPPDHNYFSELFRVSKSQIIWGANHFISKISLDSPCWIVWDKDNSGNFADCELAWTSFESAVRIVKIRWNGMLQHDMKNKEDRFHPTQKPIKLYKWILDKYAQPGDNILDTHVGSGSSRIACHDYGFDFTGFELDTDYFHASQKRFNNHILQQKLF